MKSIGAIYMCLNMMHWPSIRNEKKKNNTKNHSEWNQKNCCILTDNWHKRKLRHSLKINDTQEFQFPLLTDAKTLDENV